MDQFRTAGSRWDDAVVRARDVDKFCSSTDWILPAHDALMPPREPWLFRGVHGVVAMAQGSHPDGWHYVEPLEAAWGLACPFMTDDGQAFGHELVSLFHEREDDWDLIVLSGMPQRSRIYTEVLEVLWGSFRLISRSQTRRNVATLSGGLDGFLARRTRNFRRGLRKAKRHADAAGIVMDYYAEGASDPDELYARVLDVEARSWKGKRGVGIIGGAMEEFYRLMVRRLARRDALRIVFARHEQRDVGYVLGGVLADTYRGLQVSFDADYQRYSIGGLCQLYQIAELCASGYARYDLGTYMDYKLRWAESTMDSAVLLLSRG